MLVLNSHDFNLIASNFEFLLQVLKRLVEALVHHGGPAHPNARNLALQRQQLLRDVVLIPTPGSHHFFGALLFLGL